MLSDEIRAKIIAPSLREIGLWSNEAEALIYATALVETGFNHIAQLSGPALGFYQCEPATYESILLYLKTKPDLAKKILGAIYRSEFPQDASVLMCDIKYATIICRIHYYRIKESLPVTPEGLTNYYLKYYNTSLGKATFDKCINQFKLAAGK
jgi:hypothetical protein